MYKLLIVDDEEHIRNGLSRSIDWDSLGFQVVGTAANGEAALEKVVELGPDVVLTDIQMPRMNGLELMEKLAERHPQVKIAVISGYSEFEYAQKAIQCGAVGYVLKPTKIDELKWLFGRILRVLDKDNGIRSGQREGGGVKSRLVLEAERIIERRACEDISLQSVADELHISPSYLSRIFKKETGDTFVKRVMGTRIGKAEAMMKADPELRAYEVSEQVGFAHPKYFCMVFKEVVGITFNEYKEKLAEEVKNSR